jgi:hypothetical protein
VHHKAQRCTAKEEFIEAKPYGSEDLVSLDIKTYNYGFIKKLASPSSGK